MTDTSTHKPFFPTTALEVKDNLFILCRLVGVPNGTPGGDGGVTAEEKHLQETLKRCYRVLGDFPADNVIINSARAYRIESRQYVLNYSETTIVVYFELKLS